MATDNNYERIGSLVFYTINKFGVTTNEAKNLFVGTLAEEFIEPPSLSQMRDAFVFDLRQAHAGVYHDNIQAFSQMIDRKAGLMYIVFFTGNVKEQGDKLQFHECAKYLIDNKKLNCTLLNADDKWMVSDANSIGEFWEKAKLWGKVNLGIALSRSLKKHGYKFGSSKKDLHFVPSPLTNEFYKLKDIIAKLNGSCLSIAPIICGGKDDAEEYRKIITHGFELEMMSGKKALFEICLHLYSQQKQWDGYQRLVRDRDIEGLKATHIAKTTRYGQQITSKLEALHDNACDTEWGEFCEEWVFSVSPCRRIRGERLFNTQESFRRALDKIAVVSEVRYFESIKEEIQQDVLITAKILSRVAEQAIDNALQII